MDSRREPLVSIVMPLYNAEPYLEETLDSIVAQTHEDWELVIVDDCSTDGSLAVARRYEEADGRIHVFRNAENRGAASSRNEALSHVCGRFVAYIDADDLWAPAKLERQLSFMGEVGAAMCFTSYETVGADGGHRNYVRVPGRITYDGFLKNTVTCSHTIMFDLSSVPVERLLCPELGEGFDFPEDMVVWLQVLKAGTVGYGLDEVLAKYRRHGGSRSSNKLRAVSRTWNAYRRVEHINPVYSAYCLFWQLFHAVLKRI